MAISKNDIEAGPIYRCPNEINIQKVARRTLDKAKFTETNCHILTSNKGQKTRTRYGSILHKVQSNKSFKLAGELSFINEQNLGSRMHLSRINGYYVQVEEEK